MKLHFEWNGVERLLEEVNSAKTARTLYEEETGKGLWLVGDTGVYLMANTTDGKYNSKKKKDEKHFSVYAEEVNPEKMEFDVWWDNKRRIYGGDDGVDFLSLTDIDKMLVQKPTPTSKPLYLRIKLSPKYLVPEIVWDRSGKR